MCIDLHLHSFYSDGTASPAELVQTALGSGLRAVALTDHDTVEGIEEFDPVVMVISPQSNQLAYNDNLSRVEGETQAGFSLEFPASGNYLIRVDTFNGVSGGQANLYVFDV